MEDNGAYAMPGRSNIFTTSQEIKPKPRSKRMKTIMNFCSKHDLVFTGEMVDGMPAYKIIERDTGNVINEGHLRKTEEEVQALNIKYDSKKGKIINHD